MRRSVVLPLGAVLVAAALGAGCAQPHPTTPGGSADRPQAVRTADAGINALLNLYDLHRAKATKESTGTISMKWQNYDLYQHCSREIGLDLTEYRGRELDYVRVTLEERSPGDDLGDSAATAVFFIDGVSVVGAAVELPGYYPGIGPLNDHSEYAVPGFAPQNLDFRGVREVKLIGPWDGKDWTREVTLSGARATEFLGMLSSLQSRDGGRYGVLGSIKPIDEEYMFRITWDDGAEIRVRLTTEAGSGDAFVTYDLPSFARVYFVPSAALRSLVATELSAGSSL